jgi:hypothetical protein
MRFLTADQKQQRLRVCEELRQIAFNNATFLSRVITDERAGFTVKILRRNNNPPSIKVQNSPRPKRGEIGEEQKSRACSLFSAGQTVASVY